MAKPLSILFVTSEIYPYAKETGVSDFSYSFPLAMRELSHDIRIMTPKYGIVSERKNKIHEINRLRDIPIPIGENSYPATIKSSSLANQRNKVQAYITTNQEFFDSRKGVYHDLKTWELYQDNFDRFAYFSRSVVETCMLLGWYPDIIHCNDWHTATIPAMIRTVFPNKFKKTRSLLTIHNLHGQPNCPVSEFPKTGLSKDILPAFRHKNTLNLIKGGIIYANAVTTVSPTYAKLLSTDKDYTNGLNSVFKEHSSKFQGVLNGIESYTWNPSHDDLLKHKYEGGVADFKYNNKVELCNEVGFEYSPKTPLIAMISKIDNNKGVDLLIDSLPEILKKDVQVVFLGLGDDFLKSKLTEISDAYPDKFKTVFRMDEPFAHLIEAGSDMFLLPSENEPFGLNLPYSLAYGSVPIVYWSGGFKDIAKDYNPETGEGNCFVFENKKITDFVKAIGRAVKLYTDKTAWESLMVSNMEKDYTWKNSAVKYDEIYRNIMKEQTS